jgi:Kdo2-lipid IVA lauroyltransferase/acyltransferase
MVARISPFRMTLYRAARRLNTAQHWLVARLTLSILSGLRRLPPDRALDFIDRWARRLGPLTGRHKVALDNLRQAFPDKPDAEIQALASHMWGNMGRLAAEYIFLEQIYDFDPATKRPGRVEVMGDEIFHRIRDEKAPHILFSGHIGSFEMMGVAASSLDLDVTVLFRAPNNPFIAEELFSARRSSMGELLASKAGAAFGLARVLERGGNIGVLVDQKFRRGIPTTFFGRLCETNPLLPRLARHYDCDVYPVRCLRLPANRFRLQIFEKLVLPRDETGEVDVKKTAQLLNDVVEEWVREDPGQWMWFHRRWGISKKRARRGPRR